MKNVLIISSKPSQRQQFRGSRRRIRTWCRRCRQQSGTDFSAGQGYPFCRGCLACQKIGKCVIADDSQAIVAKMHDADVIAFATPIYYYEMSGTAQDSS